MQCGARNDGFFFTRYIIRNAALLKHIEYGKSQQFRLFKGLISFCEEYANPFSCAVMMDLSNRKVLAGVEHVWVTNSRTYLSEAFALSKQ